MPRACRSTWTSTSTGNAPGERSSTNAPGKMSGSATTCWRRLVFSVPFNFVHCFKKYLVYEVKFWLYFAIQILQSLDVTGLVKTSFMDCTCAFILFAIDECRKLKDGGPDNKIVITTTTLPDLLFRPVKGYSLGSA